MFRPLELYISHLLAPFRMGIEEGMGVKIQREVPLVIPQLRRPWPLKLQDQDSQTLGAAQERIRTTVPNHLRFISSSVKSLVFDLDKPCLRMR